MRWRGGWAAGLARNSPPPIGEVCRPPRGCHRHSTGGGFPPCPGPLLPDVYIERETVCARVILFTAYRVVFGCDRTTLSVLSCCDGSWPGEKCISNISGWTADSGQRDTYNMVNQLVERLFIYLIMHLTRSPRRPIFEIDQTFDGFLRGVGVPEADIEL